MQVVDKYKVEVEKKDGKFKSFIKKNKLRSKLVVSDDELKKFNETSKSSCQRYYVNETETKKLNTKDDE
jgi:hypothetical protein